MTDVPDPQPPAPEAEPDPLAGLPPDLAAILRDQSIIVPQDARVFELIAKWAKAPSDTASADLPAPEASALPASIVVDANGSYWRNFGQYFSKCPVSSDNDPIEIIAVYDWAELGRESSAADEDGASEAEQATPGHHESVGERQGRQPAPAVSARDRVEDDIDFLVNCARTSPPLRDAVMRLIARLRDAERERDEVEREVDAMDSRRAYEWTRAEAAEARVRELEQQFDELDAYRGATAALRSNERRAALRSNERRIRELEAALRRLGSTEGFCGALDASHAHADALWRELRARGEYARALLGSGEEQEPGA